jgi:hypothetical protein
MTRTELVATVPDVLLSAVALAVVLLEEDVVLGTIDKEGTNGNTTGGSGSARSNFG